MKASEVLSEALEFWGPEMENWVAGTIGNSTSACLLGGMIYATNGHKNVSCYGPLETNLATFRKAEKFVLDELETQGWPRDIINFNDTLSGTGYGRNNGCYTSKARTQRIRAIVCSALKRALAAEA